MNKNDVFTPFKDTRSFLIFFFKYMIIVSNWFTPFWYVIC